MRKCVVVSDSFKGTISSKDICTVSRERISNIFPECEVITLPVADGGEGTVDCFISAMSAVPVHVEVTDALFEKTDAVYAVYGDTAVIEMSAAAGLPAVGDRKNPGITTTYGVGEMILDAVRHGVRKILLGLGGSATNDAACGCAAALGTEFYDAEGKSMIPTGATLKDVARYDNSRTEELLNDIEIIAICDVRNPLYGEDGAAYVFGPQKGADHEMVISLDAGLRSIGSLMDEYTHRDISGIPGAGAAGGMGAGAVAFFGAELKSGIEAVLDIIDFDDIASDADLVITGEGRLDSQSFKGKVPDGVSSRTRKLGIPLIAIVGMVDDSAGDYRAHGISAVFTTNRASLPYEKLKPRALVDYAATLDDILSAIKISEYTERTKS